MVTGRTVFPFGQKLTRLPSFIGCPVATARMVVPAQMDGVPRRADTPLLPGLEELDEPAVVVRTGVRMGVGVGVGTRSLHLSWVKGGMGRAAKATSGVGVAVEILPRWAKIRTESIGWRAASLCAYEDQMRATSPIPQSSPHAPVNLHRGQSTYPPSPVDSAVSDDLAGERSDVCST